MSIEALPQTRSFSVTNAALVFITATLCCACLWLASQPVAPILRLAAAIAFGFLNNTMFSLTHEAVHGMLHQNRTVNETTSPASTAYTEARKRADALEADYKKAQADLETFKSNRGVMSPAMRSGGITASRAVTCAAHRPGLAMSAAWECSSFALTSPERYSAAGTQVAGSSAACGISKT